MKETSSNELRDAKPILDVCCGGRMFYADEDLGRHWNELNSKQIKVLLFSYFRFKRQFLGVVSEMQLLKDIDDIEDFLSKNYPFYGLLVVRGNEIFVKRSAKRLRGKQDIFSNKSLRDKLILRMSSELANLRSEALN